MSRNHSETPTGGMFFGSDGAGVQVMGEQLREVDAPIEGLVGAAASGVSSAVIAGIGSSIVTIAHMPEEQELTSRALISGLKNHTAGIIATILAGATIGGLVRYSRAAKHNEWSQKHYDFMHDQQELKHDKNPETSFAEKEHERKTHEQIER